MTPQRKHFWRWAIAAMALTTIGCLLPYVIPSSYGVQPDWQTKIPGGQPFLLSQASLASNSQTCSISAVKTATLVVIEGDMTSHTGYTVNDSQHNVWTTASTADNTFGHVHNGAFDFSYWVFFATAKVNGTDNIVFNGTAVSTSALYCATIGAQNTTGWYVTPSLPVFVANTFTPFPNSSLPEPNTRQFNFTTAKNDYSGGLSILFGTAYISTQLPNFAIQPAPPFITQCFVGAPAACSFNSQNSGLVSYNFMLAHNVGGEIATNTWAIQQNSCTGGVCASAGWSVLISFPSSNSCLGCITNTGGTPNTPNNLDIGSLINLTLPVWIYILLPSFLLGMAGAYFGMGIYGFVFGGIFGALTGVLANQLETYNLLVMLYGSVALLYATGGRATGGMDDEPVEEEGFTGEDS